MAPSLPVAFLIAGGETIEFLSSTSGKGGHNQELALSAALQMESMGMRNVVLASVGTDGTDGPTDAAGAIVDGTNRDWNCIDRTRHVKVPQRLCVFRRIVLLKIALTFDQNGSYRNQGR